MLQAQSNLLDSCKVVCDPRLLLRSPAEYTLPEPSVDLETDVLAAFARGQGSVVLHEKEWSRSTELGKGLRSVDNISSHRSGWLKLPLSALGSKKVRRVLWWGSVVAPLTFFLELDRRGEDWGWFEKAWPEVGLEEKEILASGQRSSLEYLHAPLEEILSYIIIAKPLVAVAFFDEGLQAAVWDSMG
jgi:hypothetical protein